MCFLQIFGFFLFILPFSSYFCHYSQGIVVFLVSKAHIDSKLSTEYSFSKVSFIQLPPPPHSGAKLNFLCMCFKYIKKLIFRFQYTSVNEKSKKILFLLRFNQYLTHLIIPFVVWPHCAPPPPPKKKVFFISTFSEPSVNRKDLPALTFVGPTMDNLVPDPLAVLLLNN